MNYSFILWIVIIIRFNGDKQFGNTYYFAQTRRTGSFACQGYYTNYNKTRFNYQTNWRWLKVIYGANTMVEKILHWLPRNQIRTIQRLLPQPLLPLLFVFKIKRNTVFVRRFHYTSPLQSVDWFSSSFFFPLHPIKFVAINVFIIRTVHDVISSEFLFKRPHCNCKTFCTYPLILLLEIEEEYAAYINAILT